MPAPAPRWLGGECCHLQWPHLRRAWSQGSGVSSVASGLVSTEMLAKNEADLGVVEQIKSLTPLGRVSAPDKIADVVLSLASDAAFPHRRGVGRGPRHREERRAVRRSGMSALLRGCIRSAEPARCLHAAGSLMQLRCRRGAGPLSPVAHSAEPMRWPRRAACDRQSQVEYVPRRRALPRDAEAIVCFRLMRWSAASRCPALRSCLPFPVAAGDGRGSSG